MVSDGPHPERGDYRINGSLIVFPYPWHPVSLWASTLEQHHPGGSKERKIMLDGELENVSIVGDIDVNDVRRRNPFVQLVEVTVLHRDVLVG